MPRSNERLLRFGRADGPRLAQVLKWALDKAGNDDTRWHLERMYDDLLRQMEADLDTRRKAARVATAAYRERKRAATRVGDARPEL